MATGLIVLNQVVFGAGSENNSLPLADRSGNSELIAETKPAHGSQLSRAQSARKAGDRDLAISLYKEIVMLEPGNLDARLMLASTLGEAGRLDEARSELNSVQKIRPTWVQLYLTRARIEQEARNEVAALKAFNHALIIEPENRAAREGKLLAISRLGSADIALTEAKQYPRLDPEILQRLHEDKAAQAIRRSEAAYHDTPAQAIPALDRAIMLVEENIKRYPTFERSRFDYVRALTNRNRYREAIVVYEALILEKRALPGYLYRSAGLAYLAEQLPKQARISFQAALASDPNDFDASIGLFYALSDLTEFSQAKAHIDALAASPLDPEKKFEAEVLAIWARAYEDQLGVAQKSFSALQTRAPASSSIQNALGRIYIWRGWPRRAHKEFALVEQEYPNNIEAETGLTEVDMALGDYRSAAGRVTHLNTQGGSNESIKRLNRAQALRGLHELSISVGTSQNKERASTGQSLHLDTRIYTAPINYQYRVFGHQYYESSRFDSGMAYYKRLGLGLESVIAHWAKLEIEIQQEFFQENRNSLVLRGESQFSDFWQLKGRYDTNSVDVPLRARVNGIRGESFSLSGIYRWSELASIEAGTQYLFMTDGNDRRSLSVTGGFLFIQGPFYKAGLALDVSASTNTLVNTTYFNPTRDQTVQLTLKNEWLGYRRYTRSFYQRLYLSAGGYTQRGFGTQTTGSARYEHEWNFSDTLNARYGLAYVRRAFDGEPSMGTEGTLSVNWKF